MVGRNQPDQMCKALSPVPAQGKFEAPRTLPSPKAGHRLLGYVSLSGVSPGMYLSSADHSCSRGGGGSRGEGGVVSALSQLAE